MSFALAGAGACTTGEAAAPSRIAPAAPAAPGANGPAPTWFRDVEPIVQVECAGCHVVNGTGAFPLDEATSTSLATLLAQQVSARDMPPWPPSSEGAEIAGARSLGRAAVATIEAWAAAGAPAGDPRDHQERAPRIAPSPVRPPELRLEMPVHDVYVQPVSPFVTDEIRCFVLDLPAASAGVWVTAARWRAGTPVGIHGLGGVVLDAAAAVEARTRAGVDGRAGFECGGGLGALARGVSIGASGTGSDGDGATTLPVGTAVRIPAGGAVLMRVHYAVKHLGNVSDRSGVDLWLADEQARRSVRPLAPASLAAPVEVPCPSGVSLDPSSPCSREGAFARLAPADPGGARARADAVLASCSTTLAQATSSAQRSGDHLFVPTACASAAPYEGTIRVVEARMQTRGSGVLVEAEGSDGTWSAVLDIPRWRWSWQSSYVLTKGVAVQAGRRLRVSCTFDNGAGTQWSALTGEPGHDAPARPPLLAAGYLVAAPHRAAEACEAYLGIERAPFRGATWPTLCAEAQAVHAEACGEGAIDLVSRGCTGADEDASVAILAVPPAAVRARFCPAAAP